MTEENINILVLHGIDSFNSVRRSTSKHLQAFENYIKGARIAYHYLEDDVTDTLRNLPFDVIVLDATFLCWRWVQPRSAFEALKEKYGWVKTAKALKLAFPQDDYDHAWVLDDWLSEYDIDLVYTVCPDKWDLLYPKLSTTGKLRLALTGYVDDGDVAFYRSVQRPFAEREIDVGYRVRRLPPNFGRFGLLKSDLGRAFDAAAREAGGLITDISDDPAATLMGDLWPRFLGNCRFALGCESGSGVLDRQGEVGQRIKAFCADHPDATFDEIEAACLSEGDVSHVFSTLSPRIFEVAMAGCCPILLEGHYGGLLTPGVHYISVRSDFSNMAEVIEATRDLAAAEKMAERAAEAVLSADWIRYSAWAKGVSAEINGWVAQKTSKRQDYDDFWSLTATHHREVLEISRLRYKAEMNDLYNQFVTYREASYKEILTLRAALEESAATVAAAEAKQVIEIMSQSVPLSWMRQIKSMFKR